MKDVDDMAASLVIEEESGTSLGLLPHPRNGYYAGDFSTGHDQESRGHGSSGLALERVCALAVSGQLLVHLL